MAQLNTCLDAYTDAVCVLCSVLGDQRQQEAYQDHLLVWVAHCEHLRDNARDVIEVLEAAQHINTTSTTTVQTTADIGSSHSSQRHVAPQPITSQMVSDSVAAALA